MRSNKKQERYQLAPDPREDNKVNKKIYTKMVCKKWSGVEKEADKEYPHP